MKLLKRINLISLIILIILSQNISYVFATSGEDTHAISITAGKPIEDSVELTVEATGQGEEIIIEFPSTGILDDLKTRELNTENTLYSYDSDKGTLTLPLETGTETVKFRFVATLLSEGDNNFKAKLIQATQEVTTDEAIVTIAPVAEPEVVQSEESTQEDVAGQEEATTSDETTQPPAHSEEPTQEESIIEEPSEESATQHESQPSNDNLSEKPGVQQEIEEQATAEELVTPQQDTQTTPPINPEGNLEVFYSSQQMQVLSGRTTTYQLDFKVTGSQSFYENVQLVVQLPTTPDSPVLYPQIVNGQPDTTLTIAGVTPIYNATAQTLTYVFPELDSGQSYRTYIKATPELGTTPVSGLTTNQRNLSSQVSMTGNSVSSVTKVAVDVPIVSDATVNISKTYVGTEQLVNGVYVPKDGAPLQGEFVHWNLTASSPKQFAGQTYLKEGSKIIVRDVVPTNMSFTLAAQKPGFTGVYDTTTRTITWEIDAPTLIDQELATNTLFIEELSVVLRVNNNTPDFSQLVNNANVEVELVGSTTQNLITRTRATSSTVLMAGPGVETPGVIGSIYYGYHSGAKDALEGMETIPELGTSFPTVSQSASLRFQNTMAISPFGLQYSVNGGPSTTESYTSDYLNQILSSGYRHYTMEYTVDPKLDLKTLSFNKPVIYYTNTSPLRQMATLPDTFVQLRINGVWQAEYPVDYPNLNWNNQPYVDVGNYGKQPGDIVEAYRVVYRNAPGGFFGRVFSTYDVVPGSTGIATNRVIYRYELNDGTRVVLQPTGDTSVHGPRRVNIVANQASEPTVKTSIDFLDENNQPLTNDSTIERGINRIQVNFENLPTSEFNVDGPIEIVAVLPPGVVLATEPNVTYNSNAANPNYQVIGEIDGKQLVKFTFDNTRLLKSEDLVANFNVDVTRTALSDLTLEVFAYTDNTSLKRADGTRDFDDFDYNLNGNSIEVTIGASSEWVIRKADDLQIKKEVKGELDADYSSFGSTTPGGEVNYRFNLTNTTGEIIEKFSFLDVLPSVGDLGITDNVPRGSEFDVTLTGPISFAGTLWEDRVTVLYSTAKNPSRADLYASVDYPTGSSPPADPVGAEAPNWLTESQVVDWSEIHSFKVVMNDGVTWLEGQNIVFEISARVPDLSEVDRQLLDPAVPLYDRAAWNSFAMTTNGLLAVEPLRVGVAMEYEIEEPVVEKTVNGQIDPLELVTRDQQFTWEVDYVFGNFTFDWDNVILRDELNSFLEIVEVRVVDSTGADVSTTGTLDISGNLVTFVPNKVDGSYGHLGGQTYTLEIDSKIREDVTNEELLPFIQGNGIPNQAELVIDDEPTQSNDVTVKPPGYAGLDILKIDGETNESLEGAAFELRSCSALDTQVSECVVVATGVTGVDGQLSFRDLALGEYVLIETVAPEGYTLLTAPIRITLTDADTGLVINLPVENTKTGWELPATGGIGTILFYSGGAAMMAFAGFLLFRRKDSEETNDDLK